ncbi:DUF7555 family protein [Halobacterium yunchengense]|uniref:DUF7555 family protein n=1 Tax=Halobacterium yunchengense TaxID=3108497 RepID=UPI00300A0611
MSGRPPGESDRSTARAVRARETAGGSGESGATDEDPDRVGQALDAVTYAAATTVAFGVLSGVTSVAVGGRFAPGVKYGLFVFGWLAFGYGTLLLWPQAPYKDDDDGGPFELLDAGSGPPDTAFQRLVQRLPPARFRPVPHSMRLPTGARVFAAAVAMMAASFLLETALGVGP